MYSLLLFLLIVAPLRYGILHYESTGVSNLTYLLHFGVLFYELTRLRA